MPNVTSKPLTVAVVGATGVVGGTMIRMLLEREFPFGELRLLASARSAGTEVDVAGTRHTVQEATPDAFEGVDIALFSAGGDTSKALAPEAARRGATVIDNSSAWRMDPTVPLVVSQVNPDDLGVARGHHRQPELLDDAARAGPDGAARCRRARARRRRHIPGGLAEPVARPSPSSSARSRHTSTTSRSSATVYPHQIAFNALPQVDVFLDNGYTKEEWKVVTESRKILHLPDLRISCTAVRVPVFVAHSEAVHVETTRSDHARARPDAVRGRAWRRRPGRSVDLDVPARDQAAGSDEIYVGRVRQDASIDGGPRPRLLGRERQPPQGRRHERRPACRDLVERGWVKAAATRDAAGSPA